ncbi:enoyl-CoA hydratase family protein [Streptomyces sp. URMC 123]|uniref:enoyl-CoA hydratase family protein n=1 Tax=Streptomyces sp. URMC 123 TaxID=3423403 RepID=UPI003F1A0420
MTRPQDRVVRRTTDRGITTLTLDAPHHRNALSRRMVAELSTALAEAAEDRATRAVLLTHTGTTFCAGADLREASAAPPSGTAPGEAGTGAAGTEGGGSPADALLALARLLRTVVELPKPVVARVTGHTRAGGLGLLGACDLSVAGPGANFAFTEARLGLAPAIISLPLLPRLDPRAATRYYLTGERFGAAEAARIGLITLAAPEGPSGGRAAGGTQGTAGDEAVDAALAPLLEGLRRGSPQGLAASKRLLTRQVLRAFDRDTEALAAESARLFASAEAREGMTAFLERRDPWWTA